MRGSTPHGIIPEPAKSKASDGNATPLVQTVHHKCDNITCGAEFPKVDTSAVRCDVSSSGVERTWKKTKILGRRHIFSSRFVMLAVLGIYKLD